MLIARLDIDLVARSNWYWLVCAVGVLFVASGTSSSDPSRPAASAARRVARRSGIAVRCIALLRLELPLPSCLSRRNTLHFGYVAAEHREKAVALAPSRGAACHCWCARCWISMFMPARLIEVCCFHSVSGAAQRRHCDRDHVEARIEDARVPLRSILRSPWLRVYPRRGPHRAQGYRSAPSVRRRARLVDCAKPTMYAALLSAVPPYGADSTTEGSDATPVVTGAESAARDPPASRAVS